MCVCMYVCIYTYTSIHTHTCTYNLPDETRAMRYRANNNEDLPAPVLPQTPTFKKKKGHRHGMYDKDG